MLACRCVLLAMVVGVGSLFLLFGGMVILLGYAYVLFMSVRSPPLAGVYGILCCMHLVSACVLLNISLY